MNEVRRGKMMNEEEKGRTKREMMSEEEKR